MAGEDGEFPSDGAVFKQNKRHGLMGVSGKKRKWLLVVLKIGRIDIPQKQRGVSGKLSVPLRFGVPNLVKTVITVHFL